MEMTATARSGANSALFSGTDKARMQCRHRRRPSPDGNQADRDKWAQLLQRGPPGNWDNRRKIEGFAEEQPTNAAAATAPEERGAPIAILRERRILPPKSLSPLHGPALRLIHKRRYTA